MKRVGFQKLPERFQLLAIKIFVYNVTRSIAKGFTDSILQLSELLMEPVEFRPETCLKMRSQSERRVKMMHRMYSVVFRQLFLDIDRIEKQVITNLANDPSLSGESIGAISERSP